MNPPATLDWLQVVFLGLVQGLTEFLPISSSGHLVLASALLQVSEPGIALELVLHVGTLIAVVVYYRRDLLRLTQGGFRFVTGDRGIEDRAAVTEIGLLGVAMVPAVIAAIAFGDYFEAAFANPRWVCGELMVNGLLLLSTTFAPKGDNRIGWGRALFIGVMQAWSISPAISRSGATMAAALWTGVRPVEAARFSFLLSIPAIAGAIAFQGREIAQAWTGAHAGLYSLGALVSLVSGWFAIEFLLRVIRRGQFFAFGIYCLVVGAAGWIYFSR